MPVIGKIKYGSTGFRFHPTLTQDGAPIDLVAAGVSSGNLAVTFRRAGPAATTANGNGIFTIIQTGQGQAATNMGAVSYAPTWGAGGDIAQPAANTTDDYEAEFTVTLPGIGDLPMDTITFGVTARL